MSVPIAVLLHNVRSAHNVGSIFRTADAAGVSRLYLTGVTPAPVDRFNRVQKEVAKVALGAENFVPWETSKSPTRIIERLRREGWQVVAVEQDERSEDYSRFKMRKPTLFIFGDEVRGVSKRLLEKCDVILEIPMRGTMVRHAHHPRFTKRGKESLNVSVAAGIVLVSLRRQPLPRSENCVSVRNGVDDLPFRVEESNDVVRIAP